MAGRFGPGCCCGPQGCPGDFPTSFDSDFSSDPFTSPWIITNPVSGVAVAWSITGGRLRYEFNNMASVETSGEVKFTNNNNQPPGVFDSVEVSFDVATLETWGTPLVAKPSTSAEGQPLCRFAVQFGRVSLKYEFRVFPIISGPTTNWWNEWTWSGGAVHHVGAPVSGLGVGQTTGASSATSNPFLAAGDNIRAVATRIDGDTGMIEVFKNGSSIGTQSGNWPAPMGYPAMPWDEAQCELPTVVSFIHRTPRFNSILFEVDNLAMSYNVV